MTPDSKSGIEYQLARGRAKFPGGRFLLAGLVEELGELCDAMIRGDRIAIVAEAHQVAAVAIRIAEDGDGTNWINSDFAAIVSLLGETARALLQRTGDTCFEAISDVALRCFHRKQSADPTFDDLTDEEAQP